MFDLIERVIENREVCEVPDVFCDAHRELLVKYQAINKFCALSDDSLKVLNLKKKKYADFKILPEEWKLLALIMEVLDMRESNFLTVALTYVVQEPCQAQSMFLSEHVLTVWNAIPTLDCLLKNWCTMASTSKFEPVSHGLEAAIMKIEKWSLSVEQNELYFICIGESLFPKSHLG